MPPWKPESGYGRFVGERRLTDEEIATLQEWVESGAAEGDPTALPPVPSWPEGWRLGQPDLIVAMPEPFLMPAAGPDIFRTFVLPLPVEAPAYVTAFEFQPGDTQAVHHANLLLDETSGSRSLDQADPRPGYEGLTAFSADFPDGHFLGWTPGQLAPPSPEGMAWTLRPRTDLVLQLHLRPTGRIERVQPRVAFFFTDTPPTLTPTLLTLGRQGIDIAGGERVELEDGYVLPVDVEIRRIQPHAHYLARKIEAWAELPDGTVRWLIRIPEWDFNWQDSYQYAEPVFLPKGARLAMRYSYDNSADNPRNPNNPPQRVRYGQRSTDEMAELYLQVVTRSAAERDALLRDYRPKEVREFIVGFRTMLDADPNNAALHSDLGSLYFEAGDVPRAVEHFTETLRIGPRSAVAHNNLGAALQAMGRLDTALTHYQQALELQPDQPVSHFNVGLIHELRGQTNEAARHFALALTEQTRWPTLLMKLGWIRATAKEPSLRDPDQALQLAEEAAELTENRDPAALDVLGAAYASLGRFDRAIDAAEAALARSSSAPSRAAIGARLALYRARRPYLVP